MKTIWKYRLDDINNGYLTVEIPGDSRIVMVDNDPEGIPSMWIELNSAAPVCTRRFVIRGTGHTIQADLEYVGSWIAPPFVWHLYEVLR